MLKIGQQIEWRLHAEPQQRRQRNAPHGRPPPVFLLDIKPPARVRGLLATARKCYDLSDVKQN